MNYFDGTMINRQRLLWTVATRRQLERWEPFVATAVFLGSSNRHLDDSRIWLAELEHHFTLIAARHLLRALELPPVSGVPLDSTLRAEIIEGRDLHEHWVENLPVFNVSPRESHVLRHRSGKEYDARNPHTGPYDWLRWSNKTGALLLPHVSAPALHGLLDAVEAETLAADQSLSGFVPARLPSPWFRDKDEWWPDVKEVEAAAASA